jgi:hypothetical protein
MTNQEIETESVISTGVAVAGPVAESRSSLPSPEPEDIAKLAYSYWQARGCPYGSPEEDWLRTEADLQSLWCRTIIGS